MISRREYLRNIYSLHIQHQYYKQQSSSYFFPIVTSLMKDIALEDDYKMLVPYFEIYEKRMREVSLKDPAFSFRRTEINKALEFKLKKFVNLKTNFNDANLNASFAGKTRINVISIGCGDGEELIPLLATMPDKEITYVGVDVDSDLVEREWDCFRDFTNCRFVLADASNIESIFDIKNNLLPSSYDLVISRHPFLLNNDEENRIPLRKSTFTAILEKTIPALLAQDGVAYFAIGFEQEVENFKKLNLPYMVEQDVTMFKSEGEGFIFLTGKEMRDRNVLGMKIS